MERDELRAAWRALEAAHTEASPYAERPDPRSFALGALAEDAQGEALAFTNLLRAGAGCER